MVRVVALRTLSESWGGSIFAARTEDEQQIRVRTWKPVQISAGDVFDVDGVESSFKSEWGEIRQIEAKEIFRVRTSGKLIVPWLMSLDGIGRDRAERLFDRLGAGLLSCLADPQRLPELATILASAKPNLGRKLAEYIQSQYAKRAAREDVGVAEVEFLQKLEEFGVCDVRIARKLWRLIGSPDAFQRLIERPYATAAVLPWKDADALGQRLLREAGVHAPEVHQDRQIGAVDAAWLRILKRGHTAVAAVDMANILRRFGVVPKIAIALAIEHRRALTFGDGLLRAPGAAFLEATVAEHILRLQNARGLGPTSAADERRAHLANLTVEQREAVEFLANNCFGILQGGAGVGKTTTMRALCDLHSSAGGRVLLATISGKAALRLSRATGRLAYTMARLVHGLERRAALEAEGSSVPDPLPVLDAKTLLVVDEASMVDLVSWKRILQLVPTGAKVVLVGDVAQLPPIGLGRVYHDLVAERVGVIELSKVMRQAGDNPIIAGAAAIRSGNVPKMPSYSGAGAGLFHLSCSSSHIQTEALRVYAQLIQHTPREQMLVVAGRNDTCGSVSKSMQAARLADGHAGIRLGPLAPWVAVGDPVVATANRYDQALMNGLVGWVENLDPLLVRFDGESEAREVSGPARHELASGWCLTVHRAQWSEAKRVIILLYAPTLITREWLYTAVTRGVEQVVLIGPAENISAGVARREDRCTAFLSELRRPNIPLERCSHQSHASERIRL